MLDKIQIKESSSQSGFLGKDPLFDEILRADNSNDKVAFMSLVHPLGANLQAKEFPEKKLEKGNSSLLLPDEKAQNIQMPNPQSPTKMNNEIYQPQIQEEDMSKYDDEQYEYEYDDLLVDELHEEEKHQIPLPTFPLNEVNAIMISEDPPFSEKDLEDFINNEALDKNEDLVISEGTFHSMQNSINSSSSFVNGMERLIVHQPDQSTFTSSKRKLIDGIEDTATSEIREGKKSSSKSFMIVSI